MIKTLENEKKAATEQLKESENNLDALKSTIEDMRQAISN